MSTAINFATNGSLVDDNVFSDANGDNVYSPHSTVHGKIDDCLMIILYIIRLLIGPLALASDIYLIVVISKFKNLQNRINNFIRLYAILNILYLVLVNLLFIINYLCKGHFHIGGCFIKNLDHLIITLSYYTLIFMALDWYMLNYHPNIYMRFPKTFKYGSYILFALAIPKWITSSIVCFINFWRYTKIRLHLEVVSFLLCFITIICITVLKHGKIMSSETRKTEYAFIVPRTVLLLSLCSFIAHGILMFLLNYKTQIVTIYMIRIQDFGDQLISAAPVVMLYQLTKLNKNFKSAYIKICKKKRIKNYDDENLDADSVNDDQPNNVTFDKNSEIINF